MSRTLRDGGATSSDDRRGHTTWIGLAALLACATIGLARDGTDERTLSAPTLRIVTFNVHGVSSERLLEAVESHEELRAAEVLMFQEVEGAAARRGPRYLARGLGAELAYAVAGPDARAAQAVAIVSRRPLTNVEVLPLPRFDLGYRSRRRIALLATTNLGTTRLRLLNVHLDTRLTFGERLRQVEPVVALAASVPRAVLGGDFNTIRSIGFLLPWLPVPLPGTGQARGFDAFMRERGLTRGLPVYGPTGPLGMELDALYHVGMRTVSSGIVRIPELSDHAALWMDLALETEDGIP